LNWVSPGFLAGCTVIYFMYTKKLCGVILCITQVRPQHVRLSMRVNEAYDMDFYYAQVNIFLNITRFCDLTFVKTAFVRRVTTGTGHCFY
jgi:hypothetical protein